MDLSPVTTNQTARVPRRQTMPAAVLRSLVSVNVDLSNDQEAPGQVIINFPSLPEEIVLSRSANYKVTPSPVLPDGIHIYQSTDPLVIPLTFKVHAFDDFCPDGPTTLLQLAARLHALVLPISDTFQSVTLRGAPAPNTNGTEAGNSAAASQSAASPTAIEDATFSEVDRPPLYFPVVCELDLMVSQPDGVGIHCVGYIKDVEARLKGPMLNSGRDDVQRNLPTSGEYKFTFVHSPAYSNTITNGGLGLGSNITLVQASASVVKEKLYNTYAIRPGQLTSVGINGS